MIIVVLKDAISGIWVISARNIYNRKLHMVRFHDIFEAHKRISSYINKTPIHTSQSVNQMLGANIFLKCENFQKVGAFKYRGATNAVQLLTNEQKENGVSTHSSGNHAAALALAAKVAGTKAYVVMPKTAPQVKKDAVASYGAEITFCEPTLEARESTLNEIVEKTGAMFIHPYNRPDIIAGQGTACLELTQEINDLDIIMAPVGGGGLLSGTAIAAKGSLSNINVYGAEPEMANDAYLSFTRKEFVPQVNPMTIADGLLTSLGDLTYEIILSKVDQIFTASEEAIVKAMQLIWERMKIIIEPSSAVPIAVIMEHQEAFKGKKVGIIISGGNVDLKKLPF
jgi:threonine dehydratase